MELQKLRSLVADGKIFSVDFIKRTDGTRRRMIARTGVKADLTGGDRNWDPKDYGLLQVYDMEKRGYRHIPADSITRLKARGVEYRMGVTA